MAMKGFIVRYLSSFLLLFACQSAREQRLENLKLCRVTLKDATTCEATVTPDVMGSVIEGGLSQQEVVLVLKPLLPKMTRCYEQSIDRGYGDDGTLFFTWTVAATGVVQKLRWVEERSSIDDPKLGRCFFKLLQKQVFAKPRNGVKTSVSYPFKMKAPLSAHP